MLSFQSLRRLDRTLTFRSILVVSFFPALLMCLFLQPRPASAGEATFNNPMINGYALDLCRSWSTNCGKPAADAWCQKAGYKRALRFSVSWDSPPTIVIRSGKICNQPFCDRISFVACEAEVEEGTRGKSDAAGDSITIPESDFVDE